MHKHKEVRGSLRCHATGTAEFGPDSGRPPVARIPDAWRVDVSLAQATQAERQLSYTPSVHLSIIWLPFLYVTNNKAVIHILGPIRKAEREFTEPAN